MPIVHVTPLGSSASDVGAAIGQIIDYLQRGSKTPQPNSSPTVDYYADSAEGPGIWRGRGVGGYQLQGPVNPDMLREVLAGNHPLTGEQLVTATGSAGRAQRKRETSEVKPTGPPDELLDVGQVAALLGTSEQYVRKLAISATREQAATGEDGAATNRRARLQGIQLDDNTWAFRRDDVEHFATRREEPKVVVAYDITISVEKSISLAWVHADPEQRRTIETAIDLGVNSAVSYLEEHALNVRRGRGTAQADGMWAASYRHLTNRHLEPQLHEHVLVGNVAAPAVGGQTQAIDARGLMHHAKTAGYVAGAVIRQYLTSEMGVEWNDVDRGLADLAHIPRPVIDAMSTRRKEVVTLAAELGLDTLTARQYAALTTRNAKQNPAEWDQLETEWQTQLGGLGFTKTDWLQLTHPGRTRIAAPLDQAAINRFIDGPDGVTKRSGIFARRDVVQALIDFDGTTGPIETRGTRLNLDTIDQLVDTWLARHDVIAVDVPNAQRARTGEDRWYTTANTLQLEQSVIAAYENGIGTYIAAVKPGTLAAAMNDWQHTTGFTLGDDQTAMITAVTTSPDRFGIVVGPAGTGKTAALEVAARIFETSGVGIVGVAVTGSAADQLAASTGIDTRTVSSLLHQFDQGRRMLDARTVLIVDEASLLSNRQHAALVTAVQQAGAIMRTIGDPAQHPSVDAGGLWAHLVDRLGDRVTILDTNRRQASDDMADVRLANADYREGRIAAALNRLEAGDRIVSAPTATQLLDDLAADWYVDHRRHQEHGGPVSLMMAEQHTVRRQLNQRAQALLLADGTLHGNGMRIGDETFHVGEHVVTRTRDRNLRFEDNTQLRNATQGTITAINTDGVDTPTVTVDFGRRGTLTLEHEYLTRPIRSGVNGGLAPAYAVTTHVAQGATMTTGRMIASDSSTRAGIYVGLTRGTDDTRLYVVRRRDLEPTERSDVGLPTIPDTRIAIDALADQLTKPEPAAVVATTDPTASAVHGLSKLRLSELRPLAEQGDVAARRAIDRIAAKATTNEFRRPSPEHFGAFGPRPPIDTPNRPVWDQTIKAIVIYRTRYGTDQLPPNAPPQQARMHGEMSALIVRATSAETARKDVESIADELAEARSDMRHDSAHIESITRRLDPHIEAAVEKPASYLINLLGTRPTDDTDRMSTWDCAATAIETWRHTNGLTPNDGGFGSTRIEAAIGTEPETIADALRFEAVVETINEHLSQDQRMERSVRH